MCVTAELIEETRDGLRKKAKVSANSVIELLHMHLAIEAEKYLRKHQLSCDKCAEEPCAK